MNNVIAIDVSNFAYKEFFGSGGDVATTMVRKARAASAKLEDCACYLAYDCKGPTFRHKMFDQYKAGRSVDPKVKKKIEDFIELSKPIATAAGLHVVEHDEHEADDVLASIARQCRQRKEQVTLISADKDLYSLLQYHGVRLFGFISAIGNDPMLGLLVKFAHEVTEDTIVEKYGVEPYQWTDFRCLTGDSSDNIKGMHGYGPKKAKMVLQAFDTLADMYDDWETHSIGFGVKEAARFEEFRTQLPKLRRLFQMVDTLDVIRH